jgi:aspartyl/asparaginyl-tRNA synthetase
MNVFDFSKMQALLRDFFCTKKGFVEIPAQSRRSILAACEDPRTISQYIFDGINWPLPQTGQMHLEVELLTHKDKLPGVFCSTTSYRNEPFPIEGRHDKIFPMFEFESFGTVDDLMELEKELLKHLGYKFNQGNLCIAPYNDFCKEFSVKELEAEHETMMWDTYGPIVFITQFPQESHPFWNMKQKPNSNIYNKVDVILHGMETFGSAERSCNKEEMRNNFLTVSNGKYAKSLYHAFGEYRVLQELDSYLELDMVPRYGGGIGMTRLCRSMKLAGLL